MTLAARLPTKTVEALRRVVSPAAVSAAVSSFGSRQRDQLDLSWQEGMVAGAGTSTFTFISRRKSYHLELLAKKSWVFVE